MSEKAILRTLNERESEIYYPDDVEAFESDFKEMQALMKASASEFNKLTSHITAMKKKHSKNSIGRNSKSELAEFFKDIEGPMAVAVKGLTRLGGLITRELDISDVLRDWEE